MKSLLFFMVLIFTGPVFSATAPEVLMERSFIDAVEREDVALLRKRIQIRLKGLFSEFPNPKKIGILTKSQSPSLPYHRRLCKYGLFSLSLLPRPRRAVVEPV